MKKPLVSIVTVCLNAENDLRKTIQSVLEQSFLDFEYIVIDGGSTDNTLVLLNEFQILFDKKNIALSYISENDNGTYDAMNKGVDRAKGEWINYLNAGDTFYEENTLQQFFLNKIPDNIGVCYGDTLEEYAFGKGIVTADNNNSINNVMPFCHQSAFVRTSLLQMYRFDIQYKIVSDHDLFYRLTYHNIEFLYIPVVVSRYNGQYGLSASHPLLLNLEKLRIYQIHKKWFYPFMLMWTYIRQGLVQPLKDSLPTNVVQTIMKHRRKHTR